MYVADSRGSTQFHTAPIDSVHATAILHTKANEARNEKYKSY